MKTRQKGLGRGLAALLGADDSAPAAQMHGRDSTQQMLALTQLVAGRYQPRTRMDETALQELAQSIVRYGLMQPILVRPATVSSSTELPVGAHTDPRDCYEIIAGERRFRAAAIAGLTEVPVIIRAVPDEQALALALIENIQREDLNPLEEAQAIKRLLDEFGYTHEQAAQAIGRSRSATSNLLRLLNLADSVQTMLLAGDIDMGHARALLALDRATQTMLAQQIVQKQLSVRDAERLVAKALLQDSPTASRTPAPSLRPVDRDMLRLQETLSDALATNVTVEPGKKGGGKLVITYTSLENFEGLLARLGVSAEQLKERN